MQGRTAVDAGASPRGAHRRRFGSSPRMKRSSSPQVHSRCFVRSELGNDCDHRTRSLLSAIEREDEQMSNTFNLQDYGLTVSEVHRNLPPSLFYEHAIRYEADASIAENGAL